MTSYKELSRYSRKFLAMTGYSVAEFEALVTPFQAQFEAYVKSYKLNGEPRSKRRYTDYKNSPLPTIEDKLLFILIYLKQGQLQEAHATLFGMHQPDANQWIHLLHRRLSPLLDSQKHRSHQDCRFPQYLRGFLASYWHQVENLSINV